MAAATRPGSTRSRYADEVARLGAGEILLTSMDRDGTGDGFDLALTRAVADAVPVPVVASGGVGTLDHLVEGVSEGHASAVLAASIFHFGTFTIRQAKEHMAASAFRCGSTARARHDAISPSPTLPRSSPSAPAPAIPAPTRPSSSATAPARRQEIRRGGGRDGDRRRREDEAALTAEAADVLYHLLVMLEARGVTLDAVMAELERRTAQSGLAEKAARKRRGV